MGVRHHSLLQCHNLLFFLLPLFVAVSEAKEQIVGDMLLASLQGTIPAVVLAVLELPLHLFLLCIPNNYWLLIFLQFQGFCTFN